MDASDYVRVAGEELTAASTAARGDKTFAETASAVRSHMRSATACLVRLAVLAARARRETVGQRHFDWDTPPRGPQAVPTGTA